VLDFLGNLERTHLCGELRAADAGKDVVLMGWVNRRRDHGNLIFLDLRDRSGIAQVVLDKELTPDGHAKGEQVRPEYVVAAVGKVRLRDKDAINPKMVTGEIEIEATELRVLNDTRLAPFSPAEEAIQNEEVRLKHRYIDLRREEMQRNFKLRHEITLAIRDNLSQQGFLEIETPILTKSTPEGARDFLVPSRIHTGEFYALPQSPQIFKQILMISGFDRYFQIARCFRDEDLRADRQLEFTQVDLEMSFPRREHVFAVVEKFLAAGFAAAGVKLPTPFPRITYDEAMKQFGSDKPDLRLPGLTDVRSAFTDDNLATLNIDPALPVVALRIPKVGELSRKEREDNHPQFDQKKGAKFIDDFKRLGKSFPEAAAKVRELADAADILRRELRHQFLHGVDGMVRQHRMELGHDGRDVRGLIHLDQHLVDFARAGRHLLLHFERQDQVRVATALTRVGWRFRKRGWYRTPPFLPLPSRAYLRWRMYTAYGSEDFVPPVDDVIRYARWAVKKP